MRNIYVGQKPRDGQTCTVDNVTQTFTVSIRSLSGVSPDDVKNLLQQRWEVTNITQTDEIAVVRTGLLD